MKVLIACEFSGIVRDAFIAKGHDAVSCDLLPTERPGPHIQGDVLEVLGDGWDLMIAHPPCTYLSYASTRSWNDVGRCKKRLEALEFFRRLWESPIDKICIENPQGCASPTIAKYSQIVQPWYFGEAYYKTTCLWLKNLPLLIHIEHETLFEKRTHIDKPEPVYVCEKTGKNVHWEEAMGGGKDRAKNRAKFWLGIADAMATQWGNGCTG